MKYLKRQLQDILQLPEYDMKDFWSVCPYTAASLLPQNRLYDVRSWRQLGMTWMVLSGESIIETGRVFERDHSTCAHAMSIILKALTNPGYDEIMEMIDRVRDNSDKHYQVGSCGQVQSSHSMEKQLNHSKPWFFDEKQFNCTSFLISNKMGGTARRCSVQCNSCSQDQK